MNRKQQKTLDAIFEIPTRANVSFSDIQRLLIALGAEITEGQGSRVSFKLGSSSLFMHRPHPGKEAKKYQVEATREFLNKVGIENE